MVFNVFWHNRNMNNHPVHMPPQIRTSKTGKVFPAGQGSVKTETTGSNQPPVKSLKDIAITAINDEVKESFADHLKSQSKIITAIKTRTPKSVKTGTPWGQAQYVYKYGTGINCYGCAGHGGFKVSEGLLQKMPESLRKIGSQGWFEEDCEWAAVAIAFPENFSQNEIDSAISSMKNYYPKQWEEVSGEIIPEGESYAKDKILFSERNQNNYVSVSCSSVREDGTVEVKMNRKSDNDTIYVTMQKEEYSKRWDGKNGCVLFDAEKDAGHVLKTEVRASLDDVMNEKEYEVYVKANPEKFFLETSSFYATGSKSRKIDAIYKNAAGVEKRVPMDRVEWQHRKTPKEKPYSLRELPQADIVF